MDGRAGPVINKKGASELTRLCKNSKEVGEIVQVLWGAEPVGQDFHKSYRENAVTT